MLGRWYSHVWLIDFEFTQPFGERPTPICMVARCLLTRTTLRLWGSELTHCPFTCDERELFVAYYAIAEASCLLALGWPQPARMLDLFVEFRRLTNGAAPLFGVSLIGALKYFGLSDIGGEEKVQMRTLAARGGPYDAEERASLLQYCESDVDALERLLGPLWAASELGSREVFGQALLRGRYMVAAASVEANGVPIDVHTLDRLRKYWKVIRRGLVEAVDAVFAVYEGESFVARRFEDYCARNGIPWPRLPSGALALSENAFRERTRIYPQLEPLRQLRYVLDQLKLEDLAIGCDGRNRTGLSAFRAKTGRNQPSNSRFIFGPSVWLRHLIKPKDGRAIAYCDWSAQEIAIAGALSGDDAMWEGYAAGDVYLDFAKRAGLVPPYATTATHPHERNLCKTLLLGVSYGMSEQGLAERANIHIAQARDLMQRHRSTYRPFWAWSDNVVNTALVGAPLFTTFGWRMQWPRGADVDRRERTARNFPMQANGAEMMRLAVCMAVEAGLMICAPVHDALLLEASDAEIERDAGALARIMGDASELVLGPGKRVRVDSKIIRWPKRFEDDARGTHMFATVMSHLEMAETGVGVAPPCPGLGVCRDEVGADPRTGASHAPGRGSPRSFILDFSSKDRKRDATI
jgi:hypothetical protein